MLRWPAVDVPRENPTGLIAVALNKHQNQLAAGKRWPVQ
jgi:hypothetical protein